MEENKELELRMYFFVPYNISPIQQAIQAGHAALEYANKFGGEDLFINFVRNHKTWIILNGGTTNEKRDFDGIVAGSLNQIAEDLLVNDIEFSYFTEPDLNDALTAVCFICDERVFNYEDYLDFKEYFLNKPSVRGRVLNHDKFLSYDDLKVKFPKTFEKWTKEIMGGEKNVFLRELLKNKKLA